MIIQVFCSNCKMFVTRTRISVAIKEKDIFCNSHCEDAYNVKQELKKKQIEALKDR